MAVQSSQQHPPGGSAAQQRTDRPTPQTRQQVGHSHQSVEDSEDLTDAAKQAGERITDSAASAVEGLKQRGTDLVSEQKAKAANELSTLGAAIRSAAEKLRGDDEKAVAGYAELAAERLEGAARYIGDRDVGSMVREVERVARRRPEIFLGGMFLVGLGISRFLKASRSDDDQLA